MRTVQCRYWVVDTDYELRSHGFPVRAIVPGHAGARFCKFLEKVSVTDIACKVGSSL